MNLRRESATTQDIASRNRYEYRMSIRFSSSVIRGFRLFTLALLVNAATACDAGSAFAQAPTSAPLRCAVEAETQILANGSVCEALGTAIGRPILKVRDAREGTPGEAIQVLAGDVHWIVVLLKNGRVRAWTRISKTYAQGKELATITRVARVLLSQKLGKDKRCVRVGGGQRKRGFDLAYPWVELKECAARFTEVPDPWWDDPS